MDELVIDMSYQEKLKIAYNFTKDDGIYISTWDRYGGLDSQITLTRDEMIRLRDGLNLILQQK